MKRICPVSVVIPMYNNLPWIEETLDSVRGQTVAPVEIIVVDDGSTDGAGELIARDYPDVRCIRQENGGISASRNRGISEATARYIALLDADDLCHPERLEREWAILEREPDIDVVGANMMIFRDGYAPGKWPEAGEAWLSEVSQSSIIRQCGGLATQTWLARREVFERAGGYDSAFDGAEDLEILLRLAATGHTLKRIEGLPLVAYRYRENSVSKTAQGRADALVLRVKALERYGPYGDGPGEHASEAEFAEAMPRHITAGMLSGMARGFWSEVVTLAEHADKVPAGGQYYRRMQQVAGFARRLRSPALRTCVSGVARLVGAVRLRLLWPLRNTAVITGRAKRKR